MIIKTHQKDDWWHAQCWVDGKRLDAKVALESDDDCVMTFKKLHEKLDGILVARNLTFGVVVSQANWRRGLHISSSNSQQLWRRMMQIYSRKSCETWGLSKSR